LKALFVKGYEPMNGGEMQASTLLQLVMPLLLLELRDDTIG
jgi:hypothetical protein